MTVQQYELALLALASWREAAGENIDTMLSIAYTIHNLALIDELSISAAIVKHQELHGIVVDEKAHPDVREPQFTRLLQRIDSVVGPFAEDLTNGATHYVDLSKDIPQRMRYLLDQPDVYKLCCVSGTRHFFKKTLDTHPENVS